MEKVDQNLKLHFSTFAFVKCCTSLKMALQKIVFSLKVQMMQPQSIPILINLFTDSFVCKNTRPKYSHKH